LSTEWNKTTKHIVAVGMVLFGLYLLYLSTLVLKIFVIAALVAFLLMPVVTFLQKRLKMPRVLAVLLSYLALIVAVLLIPLIMLPPVIDGFNIIAGINYQALVLTLLYSIYFSLDANKLGPQLLTVVPEAYRPERTST